MLTGDIFITGGTGTLGTALIRIAKRDKWDCRFTVYSRSELRQSQMKAIFPECRYVLGDVRDADRLIAGLSGHDMCLHFAAMKRIPECEAQPEECIATNVNGTMNVIRACISANIKQCIMTSTDKACLSATTYGASKRMGEGLFRAQPALPTRFTLCRYGNVLGSNGSVLQLWEQQHKRGEALTITDARCTRFWMSEQDAVKTIVRASELQHGQCFVPRIGGLGIGDLARAIYPDAELRDVGLRSLEKLHEDLVGADERAIATFGGYILASDGETGMSYSSDKAPRLDADAIQAMLKEAM